MKKTGMFSESGPLILVANHVSWSDIIVLGSIGELSFIAKEEVSKMSAVNMLAWLQRSVFVVREKRQQSAMQAREISERLKDGEIIVLFAEGTTGDGNRLLDFKSSLFGAAQYTIRDTELSEIRIQPVAIRYQSLHGLPLGRRGRSSAAWTGDEELGPHLSYFVRSSAWTVEVQFGETIVFDEHSKRRDVADRSRLQIKKMLSNSAV